MNDGFNSICKECGKKKGKEEYYKNIVRKREIARKSYLHCKKCRDMRR